MTPPKGGAAIGFLKLIEIAKKGSINMKTLKKSLALLLALVMSLGCMSVGVWADTYDPMIQAAIEEYTAEGKTVVTVDTAEALQNALDNSNNNTVILITADISKTADITAPYGNKIGFHQANGGIIDGCGHTISVGGSGDVYAIMTKGGSIKNLTIDEGFRAIVSYTPTQDIILDNVCMDGATKSAVGYAFNTAERGRVKLIATNCTFRGWTSFAGLENATFSNCHFEQGTYYGSATSANGVFGRLVKPYVSTLFEKCDFVNPFYVDLSALASGEVVVFAECTVADTQVTSKNLFTIFEEVEAGTSENVKVAVAQVGDNYYTALQAALAEAWNGGTVEVLDDVTVDEWHKDLYKERGISSAGSAGGPTNLVINGNGHTLTINGFDSNSRDNGSYVFSSATGLEISDWTIRIPNEASVSNNGSRSQGIGVITGKFENVTFEGSRYAINAMKAENLVIDKCTFKDQLSLAMYAESATTVKVTNSVFDGSNLSVYGSWDFKHNQVKNGRVDFGTNNAFTDCDFSEVNGVGIYLNETVNLNGNYWTNGQAPASNVITVNSRYDKGSFLVENWFGVKTEKYDGTLFVLSNLQPTISEDEDGNTVSTSESTTTNADTGEVTQTKVTETTTNTGVVTTETKSETKDAEGNVTSSTESTKTVNGNITTTESETKSTGALGIENSTKTTATETTTDTGEAATTGSRVTETTKTATNDEGTIIYTVATVVKEDSEKAVESLADEDITSSATTTVTVTSTNAAITGDNVIVVAKDDASKDETIENAAKAASNTLPAEKVKSAVLKSTIETLAEENKAVVSGDATTATSNVDITLTLETTLKDYDTETVEEAAKATTVTYTVEPYMTTVINNDTEHKKVDRVPNTDLSGDINVRLPVPSNLAAVGDKVKVRHSSAGYTDQVFDCVVQTGGYIEFTVTHFSDFELVPASTVFVVFDGNGGTGSTDSISRGKTVTATAPANSFSRSGYSFTGWNTAANGSGTAYAVGAAIPASDSNITLYAQWTRNSTGGYTGGNNNSPTTTITDEETPLSAFPIFYVDVAENAWYHDAIAYVTALDLMNGVGDDRFAPNANTTRGMVAVVMMRLAQGEAVDLNSFFDVADDAYYAEAAAWAVENGVYVGYDDGSFRGELNILREQFAAVLYRYATAKGYDVSGKAELGSFTDSASVSGYAADAMAWAVESGIIEGVGDNLLDPLGNATRAQLATMLMRFHALYTAEV